MATAAFAALDAAGLAVIERSPVFASAALGPGGRRYANAATLVRTPLDPPGLLRRLKAIERAFGRRRGRRWGARVLDLDVLLWSGGMWRAARPGGLAVPHAALPHRDFALRPLLAIAPGWRIPRSGTVRQLRARLTSRGPLHKPAGAVGL